MQMKATHFFLIVLLTAIVSHTIALHLIPTGIMSIAIKRIPIKGVTTAIEDIKTNPEQSGEDSIRQTIIKQKGINVAMPSPRMDHDQRSVVRATPDILYTACIYDLSESALHLTTPTMGGYTSISAFSHNTDNFFVEDDRTTKNGMLDVTLVPEDWQGDIPNGSQKVVSPSEKGIVLFRVLIENEADLAFHVERQRKARCTPISS